MTMITKEIINILSNEVKEVFDFYNKKKLRKSNKQKSEDISGLLETIMENNIDGAIAPKLDKEPDIILNGKPVEIKTTNGDSWRGGEYSKRGGHFVFVSWKLDEFNNPSFFIAGIDLVEEDWVKTKSKNYYATTYGKKQLLKNIDKVIFYCGKLNPYMRGKTQCIGLVYEDFSSFKLDSLFE